MSIRRRIRYYLWTGPMGCYWFDKRTHERLQVSASYRGTMCVAQFDRDTLMTVSHKSLANMALPSPFRTPTQP